MSSHAPIQTLVVLGAGGDLTSRLLLPGLASLLASDRGAQVRLIGVDRGAVSERRWRDTVRAAFAGTPSPLGDRVVADTEYLQGDATSSQDLARVLAAATDRTAVYFALPPAVAAASCAALRSIELPDGLTLALEKPFGADYASARRLNRLLQTLVPEEQVFRVDHFLGKSTVLNLLGVRFANRIIEPLLTREHVARIDIRFEEELALEGRAGYYDHSGATADMIQSHLLLVMALATMEPPATLASEDLRGSMAQVLRATRSWSRDGTSARRARYTEGRIGRRSLPAYAKEQGVVASRRTETLAELMFTIDNWRWADVPIAITSGKAIGEPRKEIVFTFRPVPHLPEGFSGPSHPARLRLGLSPATMDIDLVSNGHGDPFDLEADVLHADFRAGDLNAYGEVLAELLEGDPTLSVRGDMAEECWRIVSPALSAFRRNAVPLETYPAGSRGPARWSKPLA